MTKTKGGILAILALVVPILGGLYAMDVVHIYLLTSVYAQDQQAQTERLDGFENVDIRTELRELRKERRGIRKYLAYAPDDENANEEMDEVQDAIDILEARQCFLRSRNEMKCGKDE